MLEITILCSVIDNYGDAGFAVRLCRKLEKIAQINIRIITNDIALFKRLYSKSQEHFLLYDAKDVACKKSFLQKFPTMILQCFSCERPLWFDEILFDENTKKNKAFIINIDYLTAQNYAETFHKLSSLTRSSCIKKVNFMPGFTAKTGGLLLPFSKKTQVQKQEKNAFIILMFLYETANLSCIFNAINHFASCNKKQVKLLLPSCKTSDKFMEFVAKNKSFSIELLPFLEQENWDEVMQNCDMLFVRGEDSLSQAASLGIPFLWQAYLQEDDYQINKVNALLDCMKAHFKKDDFVLVYKAWQALNCRTNGNEIYEFLCNLASLKKGFTSFAKALNANKDFATHLLDFITKINTGNLKEIKTHIDSF